MHYFPYINRLRNALTYKDYLKKFKEKAEQSTDMNLSKTDTDKTNLTKLNFQRSNRINKTYQVSNSLCEKIKLIEKPQLWMLITEDWCGDSAQTIPYIIKISECNPMIDVKIVFRDQNMDIMDLYLTDGKNRSIPKLVAFDQEGNELFQWGPRPSEAQELVNNAKADGKSKEEYLKELHLWYAQNRGKNIEEEFDTIFEEILNYSS